MSTQATIGRYDKQGIFQPVHVHGQALAVHNDFYGVNELYYYNSGRFTLLASGLYYYSLLTGDEDIVMKSMLVTTNSGETLIQIHPEVDTPTGGSASSMGNLDFQSSHTFPAVFREGVDAPVGGGTPMLFTLLGEAAKTASNTADKLVNIRLKKNTQYVMSVQNVENNTRNFVIEFAVGAVQAQS